MAVDTSVRRGVEQRSLLRQLALIQARRFARHPLFLGPVALLVLMISALSDDAPRNLSTLGDNVAVAFTVGVFGMVVAYRLTRTEDEAVALLPSAPVPATTRTLALVAACLVPAAVGLAALVARYVTWYFYPPPDEVVTAMGGWGPVTAMQVSGFVVASFGGPVLGVVVGRWLTFPGAGVLATVLLVAVVIGVGGAALQIPGAGDHWPVRVLGAGMPWQDWVVIDQPPGERGTLLGVRPGSPYGQLLYALCLCGLAVWAAVMKDAEGSARARWWRIGVGFAAAAVVTYAWTLLG